MAFEAIDLDRFIAMAADTETVRARSHAVILGTGMAFDTTLQAVLGVAHTLVHRFVALVLEQIHVVLAHPLNILHTLPALPDIQLGGSRPGSPSGRNEQAEQQGCEQLHHSPRPIWM